MSGVDAGVLPAQGLRAGDRVRLRPISEIAETLDENGRTDLLPFMREMLALEGRELSVESRADKTCDTINLQGCTRAMTDTVHLQGARCDGSFHGGCQAYCLLYVKEQWLERVPDGSAASAASTEAAEPDEAARADLEARLDAYADNGPDHYRCQATQALEATTPLVGWRHYATDLRTRNVPLRKFSFGVLMAAVNKYQSVSSNHLPARLRYRDGHRLPDMRGTVVDGQFPEYEPVGLEPGDLVEVRGKDEIRATLDADQTNRGLRFDEEMAALCGQRGRVLFRVERLIDEKTGRMLRIKKDLYVVSGMVGCQGTYHKLCTRSVIAMMREAWLRKVG
jgi:hypothetical protein